MTGDTTATTREAVSTHSSSTQTEFISEDVYAETNGSFTRVTCREVYAFSSIATSNDFSETATSLQELCQFAIEVEYPNGETEVLIFQPRNLLHYPIEHRQKILEAMFTGGTVWVGDHNNIFSNGLFPKTWGTIVVPDEDSVESVFSYRNNSLTSLYTDGKEQFFSMGSGLGILLGVMGVSGLISLLTTSMIPIVVGIVAYFAFLKSGLMDSIVDTARKRFMMDTPHLWSQRESVDEIDEIEPMSQSLREELLTILCGFDSVWTDATVLNVEEAPSETTLTLLTAESATEIDVVCKTPADNSDRFLLNRIVSDKDVGSVRMLEGEQVQISLSSLGREDDVTKNETYRLRA